MRERKALGFALSAWHVVIGFGMAARDNGTAAPEFEGTWKQTWDDSATGTARSVEYTFTGSNFVLKTARPDATFTFSGTFTVTDTAITFTIPDYNERWTQEYTITGTTLTLFHDPGSHYKGEFLKE